MYIYYFCQSVQLPDGFQASVTHIDTVHCSSSLALTNIFHISSVKFNLLSISQLTKSTNYDVTFSFLNLYFRIRQQRRRLVGVVLEMVFFIQMQIYILICLTLVILLGLVLNSLLKILQLLLQIKILLAIYVRALNNSVFLFSQSTSCSSH